MRQPALLCVVFVLVLAVQAAPVWPTTPTSPSISVTPSAISDTLQSGTDSTHTLTIENLGDEALIWHLAIGSLPGSPLAGKRLIAPRQYDGVLENNTVAQALVDSGVVVENARVMFDPGTLQNYDLLWVRDPTNEVPGGTWPQWALDEARDWLHAGGRLLISTDNADQVVSMNSLFASAGVNILMLTQPPFFGTTTDLVPHTITLEVDSLFLLDSSAFIATISAPAAELARYPDASIVAGRSGVGLGRLVVIASQVDLAAAAYPDNLQFMVQAFRWLALPFPGWASVDPSAGTLPVGGSVDVDVSLDANGLLAGDYQVDLVIASNDSLTGDVVVPVHLTVTGAPMIALSANTINFGGVYLLAAEIRSLTISNNGTDVLNVSAITTDNPVFSAVPAAFAVPPGQSQIVDVTFLPVGVGLETGTLTITSDDPIQPTVDVALTGIGIEGYPNIVVSDSLVEFGNVGTGSSATDTITVSNTGTVDPLIVNGLSVDNFYFSIYTGGFQVPAGGSQNVVIWFDPIVTGPQQGTLTIDSNDPDEPLVAVSLMGVGVDPPTAWVVPDSIVDTLIVDASAQHTISISNTGDLDLTATLRVTGSSMGVVEDYEDGNLDGWMLQNDPVIAEVTDETAAKGTTYSFHLRDLGGGGNDANVLAFPPISPNEISFWIRLETTASLRGYTVFRDETGAPMVFFRTESGGHFYCNGNVSVSYVPLQWTHIGFRNIDYVNQRFDYYVDGIPRQFNLGFHSPVPMTHITRLELWNLFAGGSVWWDEFEISEVAPWMDLSTALLSIPPDSTVDVAVSLDATGLAPGTYDGNVAIETNDPSAPTIAVPVRLVVTDDVVGIEDEAPPVTYRLRQNHPNPFNPTTTIRYEIPASGRVRLVIYDVSGRLVRVLADRPESAGRHEATWDGTNGDGRAVASGVYFYRLTAGEFARTKKMVLMK